MKRVVCLLLVACSKSADVNEPAPPRSPELNALMNNEVNPSFTRLSFLVFHAEDTPDAQAARGELATMANRLATAARQLSAWPDPPVRTKEGRDVFQTYSASVYADAQRLVEAAGANDRAGSVRILERIAQTCNDCHHFFRLKIEDSVVKPR